MSDGGFIVADNILGTSNWWIDQETHSDRKATDAFNRLAVSDPGFETVGVFARQGLLIARRRVRNKREQAAPG
jgi:predicted O-methyltransferase YrrM